MEQGRWKKWAAGFLVVNSGSAIVWWLGLWMAPWTRRYFLPEGTPDVALLAFGAADGVVFIGCGLASAYGQWHGKRWGWPVLLLHTGGAVYAALYTWMLFGLSGGGWWGAAGMTPSLVVLPVLAWMVRPR